MPTLVITGIHPGRLKIDGRSVAPIVFAEAPRINDGQQHESSWRYDVTEGAHALSLDVMGEGTPEGTIGSMYRPPVESRIYVPGEGLTLRRIGDSLVDEREINRGAGGGTTTPPVVVVPQTTTTPVVYVPAAGRSNVEVAFMVAGGVALFAWGVHFLSTRDK